MNETEKTCPCCGRHCGLDAPVCSRGEEYRRTGAVTEKEVHGGHGRGRHSHQKNLMESEHYARLDSDGKLFAILQEVGHYCRFYFEGKGGQSRVLRILARGGEVSQRDLTEQLGIRPGSASELLGKLEGAGLIDRTDDAADRRTATVRLTEQGRQQTEADSADRDERIRALFTGLSGDEKQTLLRLTEKLYGAWRSGGAETRYGQRGEKR